MRTLRSMLGTLFHDWPRLIGCLARRNGWLAMRNRADGVQREPGGIGVVCEWEYTRTLHICDVFPKTSLWLLKRAVQAYPIRLPAAPQHVSEDAVCWNGSEQTAGDLTPQVSFLIGHRGLERLPLLLWVLRSVAAQEQIRFECIVVEQSCSAEARDSLPSWVHYQHQPVGAEMPYNRSSAFNLAATLARAPLLVFHDSDMLVPACYGKEMLERYVQRYEVINLKRFIFYLDMASTDEFSGAMILKHLSVEAVLQNATGGGSLAVSAAAFRAIGRFDAGFVGWGGEDVEFWSRCQTRKVWEYTCLPLLHLWHSPQPGKRTVRGSGSLTADLAGQRMAIAPEKRIEELCRRERGALHWRGKKG